MSNVRLSRPPALQRTAVSRAPRSVLNRHLTTTHSTHGCQPWPQVLAEKTIFSLQPQVVSLPTSIRYCTPSVTDSVIPLTVEINVGDSVHTVSMDRLPPPSVIRNRIHTRTLAVPRSASDVRLSPELPPSSPAIPPHCDYTESTRKASNLHHDPRHRRPRPLMSGRPGTENRNNSQPPKHLEARSHCLSKFYRHETLLEVVK